MIIVPENMVQLFVSEDELNMIRSALVEYNCGFSRDTDPENEREKRKREEVMDIRGRLIDEIELKLLEMYHKSEYEKWDRNGRKW